MSKSFNVKEIYNMDTESILDLYKKHELKPSQAVEAFIAHQQNLNPGLNLVVAERYEEAREEALKYDNLLKKGKIKGKLFGIPISMKESFNVKGMNTTGGLNNRRDFKVDTDAEVVELLKKEGAIILGKTNTPSLCFCQETDNLLFGRSNNPWNPECTTGGSSGGEAALIAVGGAAVGFGSDIGGSIRIPSHFNGVIGFKPGYDTFPGEGHLPSKATDCQKIMLGYGPIAKSVRDAEKIYSIISNPRYSADKKNVKTVKIFYLSGKGKIKSSSDTESIFVNAVNSFVEDGIECRSYVPDYFDNITDLWQKVMAEDKAAFIEEDAYPGKKLGPYFDFLKAKLGLKSENHIFLSFGLIGSRMFSPSRRKMKEIAVTQQKWIEIFENDMGTNGVLIMPTYPHPAKKHGKIYSEIFDVKKGYRKVMPYTAFANFLGLPAISIPCGFSNNHMPISLQLVTRKGNEALLFRTAELLEKNMGGYVRNDSYDLK
jgi:Asp-tRNA(Asn)/Glu-tRNA(Gln) amidotransferase A subunit family amidase